MSYQTPSSGKAIASLIFGIAAWLCCPIGAAIPAVVLGHIAQIDIRSRPQGGWGLATAGLILGYLQLGLAAVAVVVLVGLSILGSISRSR